MRLVEHSQRSAEKLDIWINTAAIVVCHLQALATPLPLPTTLPAFVGGVPPSPASSQWYAPSLPRRLQTLSIISTLQLAWPPSVQAITEVASVDFLSLGLGSVRPECSLKLGESSYYVLTTFHMALLLFLVSAVSVLQSAVKRNPTLFASYDPNASVAHRVDQVMMPPPLSTRWPSHVMIPPHSRARTASPSSRWSRRSYSRAASRSRGASSSTSGATTATSTSASPTRCFHPSPPCRRFHPSL